MSRSCKLKALLRRSQKETSLSFILYQIAEVLQLALLNFIQLAAMLPRFNGLGIGIPLGKEDICCICALPTDAVLVIALVVAVVVASPPLEILNFCVNLLLTPCLSLSSIANVSSTD